jgi:hypothetical protein
MLAKNESVKELENRLKALEQRIGDMAYETKAIVTTELSSGFKVPLQDETLFGVYAALCIDTVDVWKMNRIRIFSPLLMNPTRPIGEMPWAMPISAMGGIDDSGLNWVPPAGSTVMVSFEGGNRASPFYHGTVWHRNRGPAGRPHNWIYPQIEEYLKIYEGTRKGYLVGPNDESQVLPPWNTESYNGYDLNSIVDFSEDPEAQKRITYPNIYGFKTPEKHMVKMVDGDAKCNRRWKRLEIMSSCGNWMMMKDDHIHYAGQWAHPSCGVRSGDVSCVENQDEGDPSKDITRIRMGLNPEFTESNQGYGALGYDPKEKTDCEDKTSNSKIIGGHPDTPHPESKYYKKQVGDNPYFKHENECRPYKGPGTPQNNVCDLPQTGIQLMSISGHTFVMDDSVEEPAGDLGWQRSTRGFDFGCNNLFVGRSYWKSATGHIIEISDIEENPDKPIRGKNNYIRIKTATGNKLELNDHTTPDCIAGSDRGVHIQSTSNHTIDLVDETNEQCSPFRREGGTPKENAKKAYVKIRSGYGLELKMSDSSSQKETQTQSIQLRAPQKDNDCGPHVIRMQESKSKDSSFIWVRAGGKYIITTCKDKVDIVGDKDKNPSDYIEIISRQKIVSTEEYYVNLTKKSHFFLADENIFLLAGKDCPNPDTGEPGPCVGPVLVYVNGCIRLSTRVFASAKKSDAAANIFMLEPLIRCPSDGAGDALGNQENQVLDNANQNVDNANNNAPGEI